MAWRRSPAKPNTPPSSRCRISPTASSSTAASRRARIASIDTQEAERASGVVRVFTHLNTPKFGPKPPTEQAPPKGQQQEQDKSFRALQSDRIFFNAQPVAFVVAETLRAGAVRGAPGQSHLQRRAAHDRHRGRARQGARAAATGPPSQPRGNAEEALRNAPVKIEAEYRIPIEHHNPMEPHARDRVLGRRQAHDLRQDAGRLLRCATHLASSFGVPPENVSVVSPFVGGAFGSSLRRELLSRAHRDGRARAEAAGEDRLHAHADVHRPRLSALHDPEDRARRGAGRQTLRDGPRGGAQHLRVRGVQRRHDRFHAPGLRLPESPRVDEDRRTRISTRRPGCARRARSAGCSRSNARWTSWPTS